MANKVFMTKDEHSEGIGVSSYKKGDDRSLWRYAEGDSALSIMAHSMPNSQTKEVETRDSLTVPSPWSNIITFDLLLDNIIYNPTGRSKEINYGFIQDKTENEWKVLITLVALRKIRSINLEFETVNLEKLQPGDADGNFASNITSKSLVPTQAIFADVQKAWSEFTLIKINGDIIGCLTPTNLVCSSYDFAQNDWVQANGLSFFEKNNSRWIVKNPLEYIIYNNGIPVQESFEYICAWIDVVVDILKKLDIQKTVGTVAKLMNFKNEIVSFANSKGITLQGVYRLDFNLNPNVLTNTRDLIENIQGEHSWLGLLTAIGYENLSEYTITYENTPAGQKSVYRQGMFHESVLEDITARAVLLNGECIGMIRNQEFIAVPARYMNNNALNELVKCGLMNEGKEYVNPVEFICKNPERYVYMHEWLKCVNSGVAVSPIITPEAKAKVANFFQEVTNSKNSVADSAKLLKLESNNFAVLTSSGDGSIRGILENINVKIDCGDNTGIIKSAKINGAKEKTADGKDINLVLFEAQDGVICDEVVNLYNKETSKQINIQPKSSELTRFERNSIFENKASYVQILEGTEKPFGKEDDWIKLDGGMECTMIWPLKKEVFNLLEAETIRGQIKQERLSNGNWKVTLYIQVGTKFWPVESKEYDGPNNNNTIRQSALSSVSIWPYVKCMVGDINVWKSYYIYETKIKKIDSTTVNIYELEYMPKGNETNNELEQMVDGDKERIVTRSDVLPEYIFVKDTAQDVYVGAILFNDEPTNLIYGKNTAEAGLDFGTTSTTISANIGDVVETIRFDKNDIDNKNIQIPYELIKSNESKTNQFFMTKDYNGLNYYPSVYRAASMSTAFNVDPLMTGNVIYRHKDQQPDLNINSGMKWAGNGVLAKKSQDDLKHYIAQIVNQTALYIISKQCNEIKWNVSYPSCFSNQQRKDYKTAVTSVLLQAEALTGVSMHSGELGVETESTAAGKEIVSTSKENYVIVVDIGGGSTDISSWNGGANMYKQLFQTSVPIASRRLFIEPLMDLVRKDSSIQEFISNAAPEYADVSNLLDPNDAPKLQSLLEQYLLLNGDELIKKVDAVGGDDVSNFKNKIIVGFYGILFYTMNILQSKQDEFNNLIKVQLTGNGAKLYNWIPNSEKNAIVNKLVQTLNMQNGATINICFDSNNAKTETSRGLLNNVMVQLTDAPVIFNGCDVKLQISNLSALEQFVKDNNIDSQNICDENGDDYVIIPKNDEIISENPFIYDYFYSPSPSVQINSMQLANINDKNEKVAQFMQDSYDILQGAIVFPQLNDAVIATNITNNMNSSLVSGNCTSPLLEYILAIINSI